MLQNIHDNEGGGAQSRKRKHSFIEENEEEEEEVVEDDDEEEEEEEKEKEEEEEEKDMESISIVSLRNSNDDQDSDNVTDGNEGIIEQVAHAFRYASPSNTAIPDVSLSSLSPRKDSDDEEDDDLCYSPLGHSGVADEDEEEAIVDESSKPILPPQQQPLRYPQTAITSANSNSVKDDDDDVGDVTRLANGDGGSRGDAGSAVSSAAAAFSSSSVPANMTSSSNCLRADVLASVLRFFVSAEEVDTISIQAVNCVCKEWKQMACSRRIWRNVSWLLPDGSLNWPRFENRGRLNEGTEGLCYQVWDRASHRKYAMKKARVYRDGEGVPYYMLRELAALRDMEHPNICGVREVVLHDYELRIFFDYAPYTLFDFVFPPPESPFAYSLDDLLAGGGGGAAATAGGGGGGRRRCRSQNPPSLSSARSSPSPHPVAFLESSPSFCSTNGNRKGGGGGGGGSSGGSRPVLNPHAPWVPECYLGPLIHQLLEGVAYCHKRGVLHRNLKPKHLLITPGPNSTEPLHGARLQISDFALVRVTGYPQRDYTKEVVTLWYRPPEILMGVLDYSPAVDIWSVGCIFAEMVLGSPLFCGISEIDQLFQIFSTLSTPTEETWPGFQNLPNYNDVFPNWTHNALTSLFAEYGNGFDCSGVELISKMLTYDPARRITAAAALRHPHMTKIASPTSTSTSTSTLTSTITGSGMSDSASTGTRHTLSSPSPSLSSSSSSWSLSEAYATASRKRVCRAQRTDSDGTEVRSGGGARGGGGGGGGGEGQAFQKSCSKISPARELFMSYRTHLLETESKFYRCTSGGGDGGQHLPSSCITDHLANTPPESSSTVSLSLSTVASVGLSGVGGFHPQLSPGREQRAMLVDWLVEVVEVFKMSQRTVFLSVGYLNCFLSNRRISLDRLQLLGATCLHLASKYEDISYIGIHDLATAADRIYEPRQVLDLEEDVLNVLAFNLSIPTALDFLNMALEACGSTREGKEGMVKHLSAYLAEASLQIYEICTGFLPSVTAISCIVLALHTLDLPYWPKELADVAYTSLSFINNNGTAVRSSGTTDGGRGGLNLIFYHHDRLDDERDYRSGAFTVDAESSNSRGGGGGCDVSSLLRLQDLRTCVEALHAMHVGLPSSCRQVIRQRFTKSSRKNVGSYPGLLALSIDWMAKAS